MKIQEIIDRILEYHPTIKGYGSHPEREYDGFKCGDPQQECTGIVTSIAAPIHVIEKAAEMGCNLIIVHEPTFYTHLDPVDWLEGNEVFERKMELIRKHNIVIWRDHDHIHSHKPDGIFYGVVSELGWENYMVQEEVTATAPGDFVLPRITVRELAKYLKEKMNLNAVRVIGNMDAEITRVGFAGMHILDSLNNDEQKLPTKQFIDRKCEAMITLECVDWTLASYIRDAGELGQPKALIMVGHFNFEELGMKWAVNWIEALTDRRLPVVFVPSADMYQYIF